MLGGLVFFRVGASRKSHIQIMRFGANIFFDPRSTSVRNVETTRVFFIYLLVVRCIWYVLMLSMLGMTLNIIFEGYASYSIIWNHIKGYLNHIPM